MKRGNFFANCVFAVSVILTVLSFSACTDDSNDVVATTSEVIEQAEVPFSVVLKAMNSDGNDITTNGEVHGATLFVFDQNNDFFEQINVNKSTILSRRAIDINCPNSNDITVIAWSGINSGNEEISNMSKANIISDLQVTRAPCMMRLSTSRPNWSVPRGWAAEKNCSSFSVSMASGS